MDENNVTEVVETNVTEVAENNDNKSTIGLKELAAGAAVAGLALGAGSEAGKKAVDGVCQLAYNGIRWAQDKIADAKDAREEKKAERERRYQEKKAEKEAKKEEKSNK